jgi:hypothetical protein
MLGAVNQENAVSHDADSDQHEKRQSQACFISVGDSHVSSLDLPAIRSWTAEAVASQGRGPDCLLEEGTQVLHEAVSCQCAGQDIQVVIAQVDDDVGPGWGGGRIVRCGWSYYAVLGRRPGSSLVRGRYFADSLCRVHMRRSVQAGLDTDGIGYTGRERFECGVDLGVLDDPPSKVGCSNYVSQGDCESMASISRSTLKGCSKVRVA